VTQLDSLLLKGFCVPLLGRSCTHLVSIAVILLASRTESLF
jgi:hypothetical protein